MNRRTILLVEDEGIIALGQRHILERNGFTVIIVYNGEDAVETARTNRAVDLILMDIDLGAGIDGTEAARRILETHVLPIVFFTSHAEREVVEKVKGITRYGYVLKSAGEFVLVEAITTALELFEAHRQLAEKEAQYHALFNESRLPMLVHDPENGEIVDANTEAVSFYGWAIDTIIGMRIQEIEALPEHRDTNAGAGSEIQYRDRLHTRHRTAAGTAKPVHVYTSPIVVHGKPLLYSIVDARDGANPQ